jgi:hypothetical protein
MIRNSSVSVGLSLGVRKRPEGGDLDLGIVDHAAQLGQERLRILARQEPDIQLRLPRCPESRWSCTPPGRR